MNLTIKIRSLLAGVFVLIAFILLFDGFLYQIEFLIFKDYVFKPFYVKILFYALFPLLFLYNKRFNLNYLVVLLFTTAILANLYVNLNISIFGYNLYYSALIVFILMAIVFKNGDENFDKYRPLLIFVSFASLALGLLQGVGINPFNGSENSTDSILQSKSIYGIDRVYSLFSSALNFGYAIIFMFVWAASDVKFRLRWLFLVFSALCIYLTYTRTIYIMFFLAILGIFLKPLIYRLPVKIRSVFVIMFYPALGLVIILAASNLPQSQDLLSSESANLRINQWIGQLNTFSQLPLNMQIFGTGVYQAQYISGPIIDNMYLAVLLNIGYYGLICWLILIYAFISFLQKFVDRANQYYFEILSGLWLFAMINNISVGIIETLLFLSAVIIFRTRGEKNVY
ncbi:hypothetical protein ACI3L1_08750 [Deinococcus sp. SM5_A1]|uniref:hypothetical protein n=1 Tax=Deinococcus sp. SM5_A1 TaxID=3379094 RepID=UPI00385AD039